MRINGKWKTGDKRQREIKELVNRNNEAAKRRWGKRMSGRKRNVREKGTCR